MSISLRSITRENWQQCVALQLGKGQESFVAPNVFSLAQSKFEPARVPLAIYTGETMVGFIMYNNQPLGDGSYRISRLMIDQGHQGKGYGRMAVVEVIERMRQIPECTEILVEYSPENVVAAHLYTSLGFEPFSKKGYRDLNGKIDYFIIARLRLA